MITFDVEVFIPLKNIYVMDINEIINNIFNFQQNIYDSNFRYTVIPLSRETQGPLLSLVCFINNEPYNWISVYFHAEVQAIFFRWFFLVDISWKVFS